MRRLRGLSLVVLTIPLFAAAPKDAPSRPADKECSWEKLKDPTVGLETWVERCDYGFRRIRFELKEHSLVMTYSDGGTPEAVVDVLDLKTGESEEEGLRRLFSERTPKDLASRCVLAPYKESKAPPGVKRFTFVPDERYSKELDAKKDPGMVPDPACGEWGETPDGIQYFETQPRTGARHVLFVRAGQDVPLFDEQTLKILP